MKSSAIIFLILGAVAAGTVVFLTHRQPAPVVVPVVPAASPEVTEPAPPAASQNSAPTPELAKGAGERGGEVLPVAALPTSATNTNQSPVGQAVDALLSAKSAREKHELLQQLVQSGQIDQAIAELKQRAQDNPGDAEIPTTLGEAQLNKLRAMKDAGGDPNDIGILAMQADQSFNAALKIDPQNWEAQFVKASSMSYWPADPTRDNDVVQRLSGLIDQQEKTSPQPEFAQTYLVLGNEYLKIGQPDKAMATWQLGAQKFPNEPALQKKINGQ